MHLYFCEISGLDFNENEIAVITSTNGGGKTTILSHIVDAFYEMARPFFHNEFEGKRNKFYRISTPIDNLDPNQPSFVYFRFNAEKETIDYLDIRKICTEAQYNEAVSLDNKIRFEEIISKLKESDNVKQFSSSLNKTKAEELFKNNILTYFPSYRFEMPGYLNDPYQIKLDFRKQSDFSGYLPNPIEVITGLPQFVNWVMDIVLDLRMYNDIQNQALFNELNSIITNTLISKNYGNLVLGVGPRNYGSTRIQIVSEEKECLKTIYPSIFNLSSGESSIICLFGEILRQADKTKSSIMPQEITGIVLIDEVDKHLHIKLQKEILPLLFKHFPNVQFILSSHSPFVNMGLAETLKERSLIIDIERGLTIEPIEDKQYQEVYEMMIGENERYKILYDSIKSQIDIKKELQIITEGKNTEHIKHAISILDNSLMDKIKIITGSEDKSGERQLKNAFDIMSNANHACKFLFVWDCDSANTIEAIKENNSFYKFCFQRNESNLKINKGIENLYAESFFTKDIYDFSETPIEYGGLKTENKFNKIKFIDKIKKETNIATFKNYAPLLEKIKSITASKA